MRNVHLTLLLVAGLGACVTQVSVPTTSAPSATTLPTTAPSSTAIADDTTDPAIVVPVCATQDLPFSQVGTVGSGGVADSDSAVIESVTWAVLEGCERMRVTFSTPEGAPAVSPPVVGVQFLRFTGVIRLEYGVSVVDSAIIDQVIDTGLVNRLFVVTTVDGTVRTDIHLAAPAFARVLTETGPAAIVIDLMPGGPPFEAATTTSDDVVLLGQDPSALGYPITVSGYAAPGSADRLSGILVAEDGTVVTGAAQVGEADHTWGGFSMIFPNGPSGLVTINVAEGPSVDLMLP